MSEKSSDQWRTPEWLFDELNKEFNFDIDLCATKANSKCKIFYQDYLNNQVNMGGYTHHMELEHVSRHHKTAFMNPPYSNPKPFIEKAWEDSKYCKIICLVKCDPSTKWWATFWNYKEKKKVIMYPESDFGIGYEKYETIIKPGPKRGCEVRFFPKPIKFEAPPGLETKNSGPTFSSALLIFDRRLTVNKGERI